MDLIVTIVIGGIVGWLASIAMKTNAQMGIVANVIVGIVGSALGFWIAGALNFGTDGFARWVIGFLGAVLLIAILNMFGVFRRTAHR